jgi:molybdate transport system ATP-binding protein
MVSPEIQASYRYDVTALEFVQSGFFASVSLWRAPSPEQTERALRLMEFVDMTGMDGRSIRSLSYGQLRRLLIARALAPRPDLLLLDEPYAGLDAPSRARLAAIIADLCAAGASLVLTAHRAEELPPGLTHALVLDNGRITTSRAVTNERDARALLP